MDIVGLLALLILIAGVIAAFKGAWNIVIGCVVALLLIAVLSGGFFGLDLNAGRGD